MKGGEEMKANLVAEFVKKGIPAQKVAKEVANTLGVSEKTARNKIGSTTEFTLREAMMINDACFGGEQKLDYLFQDVPIAAEQTA